MVAQIDRQYSQYGYGKVLRRLTSYALFEGRPHTTKGQWFNPVIFSFLRMLNNIPGSPVLDKPIFITGLGRSGTTILGILLSLHRDVGFLNEPKAIWRLIDPRHDINGDYISEGGIFRLGQKDVMTSARKTASRIFSRYLSSVRADRLVDKYPELIFRTDYLLELFPDARIIFISRNGADATHSIERWSKRLGVEVNGRTDDWWGRGDVKWRYLREQIFANDPEYKEIENLATSDMDHLNRAALEWVVTMREGMAQMKKHPELVIPVKYENLVNNSNEELNRLFKQCYLKPDNAVLEYAKLKLYKNKAKSWPKLMEPVSSLFTQTMKELGYAEEEIIS